MLGATKAFDAKTLPVTLRVVTPAVPVSESVARLLTEATLSVATLASATVMFDVMYSDAVLSTCVLMYGIVNVS